MTQLTQAASAALLCSLLAVAGPLAARQLNWAQTPPEESHYGAAAKAFKSKVEALSNGDLTVSIKSNGVLGGEREILEGMQIGSIDMGITSTGAVGGFVPATYVLDLPFLFRDYQSARNILAGPIGQEMLDKFDPKGIKALSWAENGFRYITNSKHPINTPADLQGMKIRTMENDIHLQSFKAMGAAPLPMGWPEVIPALQQGTIDGQENPMAIFTANRIWESQKYASMTGHFYSPALILMSKATWDSLNEKQQAWVDEAAKAAAKANYEYVTKGEQDGIKTLREHGMEVVENIDKKSFATAMAPVYDSFTAKYGNETLDKIRAAQQ